MPTPTIARETAAASDVAADVVRVTGGAATPAREVVAVEEPLEIHVNGWRWLVTMRTPGADADLVLGMLASEGVIATASEVDSIVFRRHPEEPDAANVVDVQLGQPLAELQRRLARNATLAASSCGLCGASSVAAILKARTPLPPGPAVAASLIPDLPGRLREAQTTFATTGGLHAAGLCDTEGGLAAAREDVGRHNAVDKVIGWRLRVGAPAAPILVVSGRASFEIVQKALVAGIPIVAAVSAPTTLAIDVAERFRVAACGFVRDGRLTVYSHGWRVE